MIGEHTAEGWEARLRPHGAGRYFSAGFLAFWLCGWAVGEGFALWFLVAGVRALLTGEPLPGAAPTSVAGLLAVAGFLLIWLTLWTVGGIAALGELLRCLWSEDRVAVGPTGLRVTRWIGPFRSRREFPRDRLRRVSLAPRTAALALETDAATVELTRLGTRAEREELAAALRARLGLDAAGDAARTAEGLPAGWSEVVTPEGECVLVADSAARRRQARVTAGAAMILGAAALWLVSRAVADLALAPLAAMAVAAAAGAAWGALWLWRGRMEWLLGSGRVVLRRRFGPAVREVFTAHALELAISSDSDGDDWYALEALAAVEPEPEPSWRRPRASGKTRRRVAQVLRDPVAPRRLGAWLARRCDLPLRDRASAEARAADLAAATAALRVELARAGKLGPLLLRVVTRLEKNKSGGA